MGYKISGAFDGFGLEDVELRLQKNTVNESIIRDLIKSLLTEKELRGQKSKRTLYHIGPRPAEPKPKQRWQSQGQPEQEWERHWLSSPVKSGVFLTPNPTDIVQFHGISGNVYAYKVPEWAIAKSGGIHRFDTGSEILIPEEVWNEAGKEIEFLGKTMSQQDLWDSVESSWTRDAKRKSTHSDRRESPDWAKAQASLSGLRATSHPEAAIKMMSQKEIEGALAEFENEYAQDGPAEVVKGPRDKKGLVIPHFGKQPRGKDKELIDLLMKQMKESVVREYIRDLLVEQEEEWTEFDKILELFTHSGIQAVELGGMVIPDEPELRDMRKIIDATKNFLKMFEKPSSPYQARQHERALWDKEMTALINDIYAGSGKKGLEGPGGALINMFSDLGRVYIQFEGIIGFKTMDSWMPKIEAAAEWAGAPTPKIPETWTK